MPPLTYSPADQTELSQTIADADAWIDDPLAVPLSFGEDEDEIDAPTTEVAAILAEEELPALADMNVGQAPVAEDGSLGVLQAPVVGEEEDPIDANRDDASMGYPMPKPEAAQDLPYGDYAPEDIRVQYLRQVGQYDGNFYTYVFNQSASAGGTGGALKDPTLEEINSAAEKAAKELYTQLTGLETRDHNKIEVERLTGEFRRMYDEQRSIMKERGDLRSWDGSATDETSIENRERDALAAIGADGDGTYESYRRQLEVRGKLADMGPAEVDAAVVDAIIKDLGATDLSKQDIIRIRKRLDNGDWGTLRPAAVVEPSENDPLAGLREPEREGLLSRLWGNDEEDDAAIMVDAPAQPAAPTPTETAAILPQDEADVSDPALPDLGGAVPDERPAEGVPEVSAVPEGPLPEGVAPVVPVLGSTEVPDPILHTARPPADEEELSTLQRLRAAFVTGDANAAIRSRELARDADGVLSDTALGRFMGWDERDPLASPFDDLDRQRLKDAAAAGYVPMRMRDIDSVGSFLAYASEMVAQSLPQMGVAVTSGPLMPVTQTLMLGGEANEELKERTDLDPAQRVAVATGAGFVMAALEAVGLSKVFGALLPGEVAGRALDKGLASVLINNGVPRAAARTLQAAVVEGTTETLQESVVMAVTSMSGGAYTASEVSSRLAEAFVGGASAGGAISGGLEVVTSGGSRDAETEQAERRAEAAATLDERLEALRVARESGTETEVRDAAIAVTTAQQEVDDAATEEAELADGAAAEEVAEAPAADAVNDLLAPVDRGASDMAAQELNDEPGPQPTTEDVLSTVTPLETPIERVAQKAALDTPIDVSDLTSAQEQEVSARTGAPTSASSAAAAVVTGRSIEALKAEVDAGTRELSDTDQQALATLEDVTTKAIKNANTALAEARNALATARGEDITVSAQPRTQWRRGGTARSRVASQQRDQAGNAMADLRLSGQDAAPNPASIIGVLAGMPRGAIAQANGTPLPSNTTLDRDAPLGTAGIRTALSLPPTSVAPQEQVSALAKTAADLVNYRNTLAAITMSAQTTEAENGGRTLDVNLARRVAQQSRVPEAEPMRQMLLARVFNGQRDAMGTIDLFDTVALATASDAQLRKWAAAKDLRAVRGMVSGAPGNRTVPYGGARRGAAVEGQQAQVREMNQIRAVANAVLEARQAEAKTARAIESLNYAAGAISAVAEAQGGGVDTRALFQTMGELRASGVESGVALREALRRHAPTLLEDGSRPVHELAARLMNVNASLPAAARTSSEAMAAAYNSETTAAEMYGENWRARRVIRTVDQVALAQTVDDVLALDETASQELRNQANEELGALAAAEQMVMRQDKLAAPTAASAPAVSWTTPKSVADLVVALDALEQDVAALNMADPNVARAAASVGFAIEELRADIEAQEFGDLQVRGRTRYLERELAVLNEVAVPLSSNDPMTDEEIGEMLINEFDLDETTAADVVDRARDIADAALGDADARAALSSQANQFSARFSRSRTSLFNVEDDGSNNALWDSNTDNPDMDAETTRTVDWLSNGAVGKEVVQLNPELTAPAADMIRKVYAHMGVDTPTLVLPVHSLLDPYVQEQLIAAAGDSWLAEALRVNVFSSVSKEAGRVGGMAFSFPAGSVIVMDETLSPGAMAAIALHEAGHAVTAQALTRASAKTREMLHTAYRETPWAITISEATDPTTFWPTEDAGFSPDADLPISRSTQEYVNSFHEWFASQVGRYFMEGGHIRPAAPTGLVARLIARIAKVWNFVLSAIRPPADQPSATTMAMGLMVEESLRARGIVAWNEAARRRAVTGDFKPGAPGSFDIPTRVDPMRDPLIAVNEEDAVFLEEQAERDRRLEQEAFLDNIPYHRPMFNRRLSPDVATQLQKDYADILTKAGVALRFVDDSNITVRDRKALSGRGVGYRSMTKSSAPPEIVIDTSKFASPAAAAKAIDEQLVVQHGLRGLLGQAAYGEFRKSMYDPANSTVGRLSTTAQRALGKLRAEAVEELRAMGVQPNPRDVVDIMLGKMAEEAETAANSRASDATSEVLERAMIRGGKPSLDKGHLLTIMARAKNPTNHRAAGGKNSLSSNIITSAMIAARDRDVRNTPSRFMQVENLRQKMWRLLGDYTQPFIRLRNHGRLEGGVLGERIAERAGALVDRLKSYHSHIHRVIVKQYGVHDNEAFARALGEFAGAIGAKDEAEARGVLNLLMSMRASVELNINNALLYGPLEDDALAAQRTAIVRAADDAVRAIQGAGTHRTETSFLDVQAVRRQMIGDLKALLLGPNSNNTVSRYVEASKRRQEAQRDDHWADLSGITIGDAMNVVNDLETLYGGKAMRAFRDSGLDARIRRLMDQTYENRVMSGIYGTKGELIISRMGLEHYSPLRGLEVTQGRFERDATTGEVETDIAAYITGRRAPGTRLGAEYDPRLGRRTASVTDVLSTANREYRISIEEMTTNYINGTLVGLATAMRDAGIGPEGEVDPSRLPIAMDTVTAYKWVDVNGKDVANPTDVQIASGEVRSVRDRRVTDAYRTMFETGNTGSVLHALPNGDYVVMAINDPTLYKAMTSRFNRGGSTEAGSAAMRAIGEFTRVTARAFTSWNPLYTTLRAVFRDVQENAVMMFFEQGVPAREAATLLPRATKLAWHLEWFFQASDADRQAKINAALANKDHPLNSFARRWTAGGVQRFEQQLELRTDNDLLRTLVPGLDIGEPDTALERFTGPIPDGPADALRNIENMSIFRRLEAHADATENAVRQATADSLEKKFLADGVPPDEAASRAYELVNSIMDFGQRSDVGAMTAPFFPFAQSALTGLHAALERRLWRGGQIPTNVYRSEIVDGHLVQSIDWAQAVRSINWRMMATLTTAGFMNVMLTSGMLGAGWSFLLGSDGDDEEDEKTKAAMDKIWEKSLVPNAAQEARSWLAQKLNAPIKELFGPDAEMDELTELRPFSVFSGWLMPWQTETQQGAAPVSYGIIASAVNTGQAMALLALGHDSDRVISAYTNAQIRNFTPLDAPYGDSQVNLGSAASMIIPPTLKTMFGALTGNELGGEGRSLDMGYEGFGTATPQGASNVPTYGQSVRLNEWLLDREIGLEQLGDEGIPLLSYASRTMAGLVPDGRFTENMAMEMGLPGQAFVELMRGLEGEQMYDADRGSDSDIGVGDVASLTANFILKGAGFAKTDPRVSPVSDYYYEAGKKEWKDLQSWDSERAKHLIPYDKADAERVGKISGSYRRVVGAVREAEGEAKKEQLSLYRRLNDATTQAERDEIWGYMSDIEAQSRARYGAAAQALRMMREELDMTVPALAE